MELCKKILEEQLQLLFEEYKGKPLQDKLALNKEICRTARMLILADYQTRYGAAGGTRQLSSQPLARN